MTEKRTDQILLTNADVEHALGEFESEQSELRAAPEETTEHLGAVNSEAAFVAEAPGPAIGDQNTAVEEVARPTAWVDQPLSRSTVPGAEPLRTVPRRRRSYRPLLVSTVGLAAAATIAIAVVPAQYWPVILAVPALPSRPSIASPVVQPVFEAGIANQPTTVTNEHESPRAPSARVRSEKPSRTKPSRTKPSRAKPSRTAVPTSLVERRRVTTPVARAMPSAPPRFSGRNTAPLSVATQEPTSGAPVQITTGDAPTRVFASELPVAAVITPRNTSGPPNESVATPVAAPPSSLAASTTVAPTPPPPVARTETADIQRALGRYRTAFSALDAGAARKVWPTVNEKALDRAFDRLETQVLSFENCLIGVTGLRAEASCSGTARYVPKIGGRNTNVERRQWKFNLRKVSDEWLIEGVDAR